MGGAECLNPGEVTSSLVRVEDLQAPRKSPSVNRLVGNYAVAQSVKILYADSCQICGLQLLTAAGSYLAAAHVRPLGTPISALIL